MQIDKKTYKKFADAHAPRSPLLRDCLLAFLFGGGICTLAQCLRDLYFGVCGLPREDAGTLASITLIFLAALLSGLGIFDRIAKLAGAGTLVPITGFANSVVSPAIDSRAEGLILGVGAKIFSISGPVLLYATLAGGVYGVVLFVLSLF